MKPGALPLFRQLTSVPTAPFRETAVTRALMAWLRVHLKGKAMIKKRRGGVVVAYRGAGDDAPALALAAHLDHPAFSLSKVTPRGAQALKLGGLPPHLLPGAAVEAFAKDNRDNRPLALGVLGTASKKTPDVYPLTWTLPPKKGAKLDFAVLALPACEVKGGWLVSRSVDDLLGCAVSLEACRRLANAKAKVNLTVLLNRAEEVGFVGALDMILSRELPAGDSYLSIESSRELPGSRPGGGPTIRLGDKASAFDPNLIALLDAAAAKLKKRRIRTQRLRLTGGTCEATAYQAFGYESAGVAVPLVNYHNGWGADAVAPEKVRVSDVEGAVELLVEAAKLFPSMKLRGAMKAALKKRHAASVKSLR
jgi:putative aminopeptidase FrvX